MCPPSKKSRACSTGFQKSKHCSQTYWGSGLQSTEGAAIYICIFCDPFQFLFGTRIVLGQELCHQECWCAAEASEVWTLTDRTKLPNDLECGAVLQTLTAGISKTSKAGQPQTASARAAIVTLSRHPPDLKTWIRLETVPSLIACCFVGQLSLCRYHLHHAGVSTSDLERCRKIRCRNESRGQVEHIFIKSEEFFCCFVCRIFLLKLRVLKLCCSQDSPETVDVIRQLPAEDQTKVPAVKNGCDWQVLD